MGFTEAQNYLIGAQSRHKELWQAVRLLMYTMAASMGGMKGKTPQDILPLQWDEEESPKVDNTKERIDSLKAIAKAMAEKINNKQYGE